MHFVLLGSHSPEICPTANAKTRELMLKRSSEMPELAKRLNVRIVSGPFVNREHVAVVIVESESAENVDKFISESSLAQWNSVRVMPSLPMEEGIKEILASQPVF